MRYFCGLLVFSLALCAADASADAPLGGTAFFAHEDGEKFIIVLDWGYIATEDGPQDTQTVILGSHQIDGGYGFLNSAGHSDLRMSYDGCEILLNHIDDDTRKLLVAGSNSTFDELRVFDGQYKETWNSYGKLSASP